MRRTSHALLLLLALALAGCTTIKLQNYQPKSADEAQVVAMLNRIPNGLRARSVDLIMQAYDRDIYVGNFHKYLGVATPGAQTTLSGTPELTLVFKQLFDASKEIDMEVVNFRLTVSGDRAVAEGRVELLLKVEAGRKEARQEVIRNDVVWRLRRTPLGWKIREELYQ